MNFSHAPKRGILPHFKNWSDAFVFQGFSFEHQFISRLPLPAFMIIAIHIKPVESGLDEAYLSYLILLFYKMAQSQPAHQFIFIHDRAYEGFSARPDNVKHVILLPQSDVPLLRKYWLDVKLPFLLKKLRADVLVSASGVASLTTKVPQLLFVKDLGFLHQPAQYSKPRNRSLKKSYLGYTGKAKQIFCFTAFHKEDVKRQFGVHEEKVQVLPMVPLEDFHTYTEEDLSFIKENYTDGREYFLYTGPIHERLNLVNLLKAFSLFKKRQRSSWKLVLEGSYQDQAFMQLLETYKYKDDVIVLRATEEERWKLIRAAYALVFPAKWEGFILPVVEALACKIPVLAPAESAAQEVGKEAAFYFDADNPEDMADKLMFLYKDENSRRQLIDQSLGVVQHYKTADPVDQVWAAIINTATT